MYVAQLRAAWKILGRQPGARRRCVHDAGRLLQLAARAGRHAPARRGRRAEPPVRTATAARASRPADPRGADLAQVGLRHPAGARPARRRPTRHRSASRKQRSERDADPDRRAARHEHDLRRRRRAAAGGDGRARAAEDRPASTSRPPAASGAAHPGLVLTVYNWARPRDLSHYETFCHYHRTLYRQVEALSVTPFAPRALDRGLTGVLASLLRLCGPQWNANRGAALVDPADPQANRARGGDPRARRRSDRPSGAQALEERLDVLLDAWQAEATVGQRTLVYQTRGKSDTDVSLLQEPGIEGWSMWTVPMSMRNVEPPVPLGCARRRSATPADAMGAAGAIGRARRSRTMAREGPQPRRRAAPKPAHAHLRRRRDRRAARADHARARPRRLAATCSGSPSSEPRLLAAVRAAVGPQVEQLLTPPVVPEGDSSGVPVAPFPRWLRCPVCSLLAPIDSGVFTLRPEPWRPERTRYVHDGCPRTRSTRPPTAFPARYLMACPDGHLDDFPWVEFLHGGVPCKGTLQAARARIRRPRRRRAARVRRVRPPTPALAGVRRGVATVPAAALPWPPPAPRHHRALRPDAGRRCCSARATHGSRC